MLLKSRIPIQTFLSFEERKKRQKKRILFVYLCLPAYFLTELKIINKFYKCIPQNTVKEFVNYGGKIVVYIFFNRIKVYNKFMYQNTARLNSEEKIRISLKH